MGLPLITVITRMMRSHRYFPQSVNYWAQRTAMVPATMTMTIGKAVGMMVGQINYYRIQALIPKYDLFRLTI